MASPVRALERTARIRKDVIPADLQGNVAASSIACSAEFKPERVFFTGGAGFIGSNVLIHMVKSYPQILFICLDNLSEGSNLANLHAIEDAKNYVFVHGCITSEATVTSVMQKYNCDTVMHFAAQSHVDRSFVRPVDFTEVNVMGTAVLLKVSHMLKVRRFLHISTDEVYGESLNTTFDEGSPFNPMNPYSASKAAAECMVRSYVVSFGFPAIVVRPNNVFGPRQHPEKLIPKFTMLLARGRRLPLHGGGHSHRSFLYVQDAAEAFDLILRLGSTGEAYNVSGCKKGVREIAAILMPFFGIDVKRFSQHVEDVSDRLKNDASYDVNSYKLAALGWTSQVGFDEGIRRTVHWYKMNPNHWGGDIDDALKAHCSGGSTPARVGAGAPLQLTDSKSDKIWYAPYKFQAYGEDEIQEVQQCLRDGWLAPGERTEKFEQRIAKITGKAYAVMVNSGSSANMVGLAALGMQPGDEVITPACTFATVVSPLEWLRLKPVFVDVEPARYVPTVEAVLDAITPRTRCIMLPNLIGSKPDWAELRRRVPAGIWLFEDSCDTVTHTTDSDVSTLSFYASHVITTGGMGGCVMFNDENLKRKALMYRDWGRVGNNVEDMSERFAHSVDGVEYDFKFLYDCLGFNMKACEMNAAFGLAQLRKLDKFKAIRRRNVRRYFETLQAANTRYVLPKHHMEFDWLAFPLMHPDRRGALRFLEANNVQVRVTFAGNITRHPAFRHHLQDFPEADRIMAQGFLIGTHHGMTDNDVDRVCRLLVEFDRTSDKTLSAPVHCASSAIKSKL